MEKRLMNVKQLSEYISMPVATIYTYINTKKIPANCIRRIGRAVKFEVKAVDNWISGASAAQATLPERK